MDGNPRSMVESIESRWFPRWRVLWTTEKSPLNDRLMSTWWFNPEDGWLNDHGWWLQFSWISRFDLLNHYVHASKSFKVCFFCRMVWKTPRTSPELRFWQSGNDTESTSNGSACTGGWIIAPSCPTKRFCWPTCSSDLSTKHVEFSHQKLLDQLTLGCQSIPAIHTVQP